MTNSVLADELRLALLRKTIEAEQAKLKAGTGGRIRTLLVTLPGTFISTIF